MSVYCCGACKPRYKRLVDNIFPANPQDGLVKNNMEKLTFYALSSPEKLDRIGDYLARRLSHDIRRRKTGFIFIAMEALDQLLVTCHAHSLNLFVESFLKMAQKLLECYEPDLQVLGATSFVKFSNIEEDTPSYHRRYDFFVSKFSSMCHSNLPKDDERIRIRTSGLRGLQGVVRKTVTDDLQVNIWEKMHMDKIVPSLLYNLNESRTQADDSPPEENPAAVAEDCFRDLVCRASYGNIKSVISPMLTHLDSHSLWIPNDFAVKCFTMVMYSVQANYSHLVIQSLMAHLDELGGGEATLKSSVLCVIATTAMIAGSSLGPSVLEVFNTLLRHLKVSVSGDYPDRDGERKYQEAIINTIGEFANTLPDYQKIEIMMFVLGQMPNIDDQVYQSTSDILIQTMILKTLRKIATKYRTLLLWNAFPEAFLQPLLRMSVVRSTEVRLLVQQILQQLIDRHGNLDQLGQVKITPDISSLDLTIEPASRQDTMFMKKYGSLFYWHIYENLSMPDNTLENVEAIYTTLGLICIEAFGDEILVDLVRIAFGIQNLASTKVESPLWLRLAMHALVAAYLNLLSQLTAIPSLCQHITEVIAARASEAAYLLPEEALYKTRRSPTPEEGDVKEALLFDKTVISEALKGAGHDTTRLEIPFGSRPSTLGLDLPDQGRSVTDITSISIDLESAQSSPGMGQRRAPEEAITFESLKKVLTDVDPSAAKEEEQKQKHILETFLHASFEDIVARSEAKGNIFSSKLNEILDTISNSRDNLTELINVHERSDDSLAVAFDPQPEHDMEYYDLFVY